MTSRVPSTRACTSTHVITRGSGPPGSAPGHRTQLLSVICGSVRVDSETESSFRSEKVLSPKQQKPSLITEVQKEFIKRLSKGEDTAQ